MNQDNFLASIAAQLGVKVADRSAYDGILVGQITIGALIGAAAKVAGVVEACTEAGTASMLRLDNTQPWRGIITGVEAIVSSDGAGTPDSYADTDIFLQNSEVYVAGSGGTLRVPSIQCGSVRPDNNNPLALVPPITASTGSRVGYTHLALPYWFDAVTSKGFRWLTSPTTTGAMGATIILHGIFASAVQSKGDSNEMVPGVRADAGHVCPPDRNFLAAISKQLLSQNRVPLSIESVLSQG